MPANTGEGHELPEDRDEKRQQKTACDYAKGTGIAAELSEYGFQRVLSRHCNRETGIFVLRVMKRMKLQVADETHFHQAFIPSFKGERKNQTFNDMRRELRNASTDPCAWLMPLGQRIQSGKDAPLTEDGYRAVARQRSPSDMMDFVDRLADDMDLVIVDKDELTFSLPLYDCTRGAKTLKRIREELSNETHQETGWVMVLTDAPRELRAKAMETRKRRTLLKEREKLGTRADGSSGKQVVHRFSQHDGFISQGGDLLRERMTVEEAKQKCNEFKGKCKGFSHIGAPTDDVVEIMFKNKWDIGVTPGDNWTSYRSEVALLPEEHDSVRERKEETMPSAKTVEREAAVQDTGSRKKPQKQKKEGTQDKTSKEESKIMKDGKLLEGHVSEEESQKDINAGDHASSRSPIAKRSEVDLQKIKKSDDKEEAAAFVNRVIEQLKLHVLDHSYFVNIYLPSLKAERMLQNLADMKMELRNISKNPCSWLMPNAERNIKSGKTAPLSEEGYRAVARLRSEKEMVEFVSRLTDELDLAIIDNGGLRGFVPFFNCEKSSGTLNSLREELQTQAKRESSWVMASEDTSQRLRKATSTSSKARADVKKHNAAYDQKASSKEGNAEEHNDPKTSDSEPQKTVQKQKTLEGKKNHATVKQRGDVSQASEQNMYARELNADQKSNASQAFSMHDGFISSGGDLLRQNLTVAEAKQKCAELGDQCKGFSHRGIPTNHVVEIIFKNKFDNTPAKKWTSYKVEEDGSFTEHNGFISQGGDLVRGRMRLDEAKRRCTNFKDDCKGFCHEGSPTNDVVIVYLKRNWKLVSEETWTSYKKEAAIQKETIVDETETKMTEAGGRETIREAEESGEHAHEEVSNVTEKHVTLGNDRSEGTASSAPEELVTDTDGSGSKRQEQEPSEGETSEVKGTHARDRVASANSSSNTREAKAHEHEVAELKSSESSEGIDSAEGKAFNKTNEDELGHAGKEAQEELVTDTDGSRSIRHEQEVAQGNHSERTESEVSSGSVTPESDAPDHELPELRSSEGTNSAEGKAFDGTDANATGHAGVDGSSSDTRNPVSHDHDVEEGEDSGTTKSSARDQETTAGKRLDEAESNAHNATGTENQNSAKAANSSHSQADHRATIAEQNDASSTKRIEQPITEKKRPRTIAEVRARIERLKAQNVKR